MPARSTELCGASYERPTALQGLIGRVGPSRRAGAGLGLPPRPDSAPQAQPGDDTRAGAFYHAPDWSDHPCRANPTDYGPTDLKMLSADLTASDLSGAYGQ